MNPNETSNATGTDTDHQSRLTRYQEAFEVAPDCQLATDRAGIILVANHAATVLLDYPKEFLIGKPLAMFAADSSRGRVYECLWRLGQNATTDAFEARFTRRGREACETHVIARAGDGAGKDVAEPSVLWLIRDITAWRQSENTRAELQRRLATAQEAERRRIARDLHDTVGQILTALALSVRAVRDVAPLPEKAVNRLETVQRLVDELSRQVHDLATRLRPAALDDLGLEAAARQLVRDWAVSTKIRADFQANTLTGKRFPLEIETTLYRILQESLNNIAKHAGAKSVAIVIGQSDGHAILVVEDDGTGFNLEDVSQTPTQRRDKGERPHLGLLGMRERVLLVGGALEIESAPHQGTTVIARIPLTTPSDENLPPSPLPLDPSETNSPKG